MSTWSKSILMMLLGTVLLQSSMVATAEGDGMAVIDKETFASLGIENSDDVWLIELCVV